jgi:hypothetical protein
MRRILTHPPTAVDRFQSERAGERALNFKGTAAKEEQFDANYDHIHMGRPETRHCWKCGVGCDQADSWPSLPF